MIRVTVEHLPDDEGEEEYEMRAAVYEDHFDKGLIVSDFALTITNIGTVTP